MALISLPAVLGNFGTTKKTAIIKILTWITVPLLFLESLFYLNGDYYKYNDRDIRPKLEFKENAKNALNFVLANNLPQPIFNNFDIGSYITYRGWPKYRVFVDGRPGEYPKEFFQNIYIPAQYDQQKFKELDQKIGFETIIFSITDQTPWGKAFFSSIVKNGDWKTVYIDDFMIVLVKDALEKQNIMPIDLTKLDPGSYSFDSYLSYLKLSLFLIQAGDQQSAEKFARVALSIFPQSPLGNALFGVEVKNSFFW